jgi:uncharacterized protein YbjT (DUF2867 family)
MTAGERNQNMAQKLTVVATGSTGKQGGAVARGLLERGHKVRAVTRDPNSSQARSLANAGATLVAASPVYFMEDLYFAKEQLAKGIYAAALPPTRTLAQVAVADIGAVAVPVLEDPARLTGKRFDLASDELTGNGREFPDVAFHDFDSWAKTQDWKALHD